MEGTVPFKPQSSRAFLFFNSRAEIKVGTMNHCHLSSVEVPAQRGENV